MLVDRRFDEFAAEIHETLAPRALVAVGVAAVAMLLLPWRFCAVWIMAVLAMELGGWFASRNQYLGRPVKQRDRWVVVADMAAIVAAWFVLGLAFWRTGRADGAVCGVVIWLSTTGFAQTFASRTPLGFAVCGVAPAAAALGAIFATPESADMLRWPMLAVMTCSLGFSVAGAQQTFRAGLRLDQALDALSDRETRYRVLADNVTDTISLRSLAGEVRFVSPSVEAALGYTPDEFAAAEVFEPVHPDDRDRMRESFEALLASGGSTTLEYRRLRKDGTPTWTESSFSLVQDETGAPCEIISVSRDINRRKALEGALVEAREAAEAAAAAKADFLANMTHELRTPLNAITGFSRILKDSAELSERDARQARLINEASTNLLVVVNDLLDFSRLDSGALALDVQPFDPLVMAHSAAMLVEDQVAQRELKLTVRGRGENAMLAGDGPRLQQVLLNLLSNAVKFTEAGGVDVLVEQAPVGPATRILRVSVSDTGIGVPEDRQEAIFERFSQADSSVSRRFGGTGLGLAICRRIVTLMDGRIGLESRPGEGSTFWFEVELPTAAPAAAAEDTPGAAVAAEAVSDPERPMRLLLVEDVEVNRELVRVMLEPFDVSLEVVANGEDAIEAVRNGSYDLVLMDVQMPVMDGLTASRRIRALASPSACTVPIIAMTANVLPEQIQRCLDAGMDGHVGKPIDHAALIDTLARYRAGRVPAPPVCEVESA